MPNPYHPEVVQMIESMFLSGQVFILQKSQGESGLRLSLESAALV
jgi:hypothetical protein